MSFKKLFEAIGDNEAAAEIAKALETDFNANVAEIGKLESKFSEAVSGRDKTKAKLRELAEAAGVDELTAEAIGALKSKRGRDSEIEAKYKSEIEKLAGRIEELTRDYDGKLMEYDSRYKDALIDKELTIRSFSEQVSDDTLDDAVRFLKQDAEIEDGRIVYKKDGKEERNQNGRPVTFEDKIEKLREIKPSYFRYMGQGGSGEPHKGGEPGQKAKTFKEMQKERYNV